MSSQDGFDYQLLLDAINISQQNLNENFNLIKNTNDFFLGVNQYQTHSYRRKAPERKKIWSEGSSGLLEIASVQTGRVILFIPSLINKSYILDLDHNLSMVQFFADNNISTYLMDWAEPEEDEKEFSIGDYVKRIEKAINFLVAKHKKPIVLAGYCMGGLLALIAANRNKGKVSKLALIATPWDFDSIKSSFQVNKEYLDNLERMISQTKQIPAAVLQTTFCMLDPENLFKKFIEFSKMEQDSDKAKKFVAIEHWINDGISITHKVARECIIDLTHKNYAYNDKWEVNGKFVVPEEWDESTFIAVPQNDKIVPAESTKPLIERMKRSRVVHSRSGHIGMIVGSRAQNDLWRPLLRWL